MTGYIRRLTPLLFIFLLFYNAECHGAEKGPAGAGKGAKGGGPPPAKVLAETLKNGKISPKRKFTGTLYYKEVSNLAAETEGRVKTLYFEEGMKVKKGAVLIAINPDMLGKEIEAKKAARGEVLSELKKARNDLARFTELFNKKLISEKNFDQYKFTVEGLENRALSLDAEIERLSIELSYKSVRAPFDGIIMRKKVERGDWVNPGTVVATVGNDTEMYLVVNVPQKAIPFIKKGRPLTVRSGGATYRAVVHAIVPQGDIRTRTFPVKLRITDKTSGLYEGMDGSAMLPVGSEIPALLIDRAAVTSVMGKDAVYAAVEGKAVMIPVKVTGFKERLTGIAGPGLKAGMQIVIKGNERLRPGQPVIIMNKGK
ncbi:MAG: efflux RND transporter periplasmic adaptor subunit [Thermodesulfobacteriota bacterium]